MKKIMLVISSICILLMCGCAGGAQSAATGSGTQQTVAGYGTQESLPEGRQETPSAGGSQQSQTEDEYHQTEPFISSGQGESYPEQGIELIAPAGVGGGYDLTMRSMAQCLQSTGIVAVPLTVTNKPGNGGGVGLDYLAEKRGADNVIAVFSSPICLINLHGDTQRSYIDDTTPIARLITDYGCFAVNADSPYENISQVMDALKADPTSLRIGGTSSVGSMDHVQFLKVARAAGVENLEQLDYQGFEDGTAAAKLMGGYIDIVSAGISDVVGLVESGELRVLAITSDKRVGTGIVAQMPTCIEQGIDVTFLNWRGIFGPADMPEYAVKFWEDAIYRMTLTRQWEEVCTKYGWDTSWMGQEDFAEYLDEVNGEYAQLLKEVGLIGK
jgi:putative tricarboxylic transport membrane protein